MARGTFAQDHTMQEAKERCKLPRKLGKPVESQRLMHCDNQT